MSDNSIPSPAGQQPTPPPAVPPAPPAAAPPAYPQQAPTYPQSPVYPPSAPAYPQQAHPQQAHPQQTYPQQGYPQQAYPGSVYPASRPTSGLAITSLICGIAGVVLFWALVPLLASIVAVITGHMALRQTKADPSIGGRGMAFAGLIMGYVMVGFLVIGTVMTIVSFVFFGAFTLPFLYSS